MPEHDDRYVRSDLPRTTGEFRAAPDASASTAEFKAFVAKQDPEDAQRAGPGGMWPEQPWAGEAKRSGSTRTIALIAAAIVLVAIVIVIIVAVG
ncbi:MAG TPA: hypothetical protein VJT16_01205 [Streptosporangiaceae bacterium]|jgi:hypothetical protein|nr:hypothetical protein [Streptosporangiaceae bacterium]